MTSPSTSQSIRADLGKVNLPLTLEPRLRQAVSSVEAKRVAGRRWMLTCCRDGCGNDLARSEPWTVWIFKPLSDCRLKNAMVVPVFAKTRKFPTRDRKCPGKAKHKSQLCPQNNAKSLQPNPV